VVIASDVDADAAELRATNERNRMAGARWMVDRLEALGGLRTGLDAERAVAIVGVLMDPVPAGRLVHDAGWSVDEYTAFLTDLARSSLLAA
jgi:hypothetical protein